MTVHFDFAENNIKSVTRRAATVIHYRYPLDHNFAPGKYFPSKLETRLIILKKYSMCKRFLSGAITLSGNTLRVGYHLCIHHILGTVFELYQSSENTHRYFHIIKAKNM